MFPALQKFQMVNSIGPIPKSVFIRSTVYSWRQTRSGEQEQRRGDWCWQEGRRRERVLFVFGAVCLKKSVESKKVFHLSIFSSRCEQTQGDSVRRRLYCFLICHLFRDLYLFCSDLCCRRFHTKFGWFFFTAKLFSHIKYFLYLQPEVLSVLLQTSLIRLPPSVNTARLSKAAGIKRERMWGMQRLNWSPASLKWRRWTKKRGLNQSLGDKDKMRDHIQLPLSIGKFICLFSVLLVLSRTWTQLLQTPTNAPVFSAASPAIWSPAGSLQSSQITPTGIWEKCDSSIRLDSRFPS